MLLSAHWAPRRTLVRPWHGRTRGLLHPLQKTTTIPHRSAIKPDLFAASHHCKRLYALTDLRADTAQGAEPSAEPVIHRRYPAESIRSREQQTDSF